MTVNPVRPFSRFPLVAIVAAAALAAAIGTLRATVVRAEIAATGTSDELTPRDLHVWGRFDPGTWKKVRVVTETLNDRGEVADTTTTETKTTLVRIDAKQLTLRIEATVEVAGKRFVSQPQTVQYGYYGESPNEQTELKTMESEPLTIDGRQVPCRIQQVVATRGPQKQVTQMFLSSDVEPYVLKRETKLVSFDGKTLENPQTTVEVIGLSVPYEVLHESKSAAYERTIQRSDRGATVTFDVTCVDVPGGIVARTSKEMDSRGKLVRRSTLELVDYKIVDNDKTVDNDDDSNGNANSASGSSASGNKDQPMTRRQAQKARKR